MKRHTKSWFLKHTLEVATIALAAATVWLAWETHKMAVEFREGNVQQIGVTTWLECQKRFDSREMKRSRSRLAAQLDPYVCAKYVDKYEDVFDLFDDIGALYESDLIDKKLTESTFSGDVNYWWEAGKQRIADMRKSDNDPTEYKEFETLAAAMHHRDPNIGKQDLKDFLKDQEKMGD